MLLLEIKLKGKWNIKKKKIFVLYLEVEELILLRFKEYL